MRRDTQPFPACHSRANSGGQQGRVLIAQVPGSSPADATLMLEWRQTRAGPQAALQLACGVGMLCVCAALLVY